MEYMYSFETKWFNEVDNNTIVSKGTVAAVSYSEAAKKLVDNFGEDNIMSMNIAYIIDTENGINVEQEEVVND